MPSYATNHRFHLVQPLIQIRWKESDLPILETHPETPGKIYISSRHSSTSTLDVKPTSTVEILPTSTHGPPSPTIATEVAENATDGLPRDAQIGIGVGIGLGGMLLAALVVIFIWWHRRRHKRFLASDQPVREPPSFPEAKNPIMSDPGQGLELHGYSKLSR